MDGGPKITGAKPYIIAAIFFIIYFTIKDNFFSEEKYLESTSIESREEKTYYNSIKKKLHNSKWRQPYSQNGEFKDISTALAKSNIRVCGEYYVKLVGNNEYVVACTSDGNTWNYFIVWSKTGSVYRADSETEMALTAPY